MLGILAGILITFGVISTVSAGIGMPAPEITSSVWLNSEPKRIADLRGKVVLVEFWTFGCYNCRNVEPYVKAWHKQYVNQGLTVIGVHAPEFKYERDVENVKRHIREHGIQYAVPIDNDFSTWNRYNNHYCSSPLYYTTANEVDPCGAWDLS